MNLGFTLLELEFELRNGKKACIVLLRKEKIPWGIRIERESLLLKESITTVNR